MSLDYNPLWDEQGRLRRGCTVREALAWLTKFGSHSAGENVCINGISYKVGALLYGRTGLPWRTRPSPVFMMAITAS